MDRQKLLQALLLFFAVTVIFNYTLITDILQPKQNVAYVNDSLITQFILEQGYENIVRGENPFKKTTDVFYPFATNFSLSDPALGNLLWYVPLRMFLDPYRSLITLALWSIFLSACVMYILLQRLNCMHRVNMSLSLSFAFMPFISYRLLGHYTYTPLYLFPLAYLIAINFLKAKEAKIKAWHAILFGAIIAVSLLLNFQYFFIIVISVVWYGVYALFVKKRKAIFFIRDHITYLILSIAAFCIVLAPWVISVYDLIKFEGQIETPGTGGSIELSTDLLSFFIPSEYNPIYKTIVEKLALLHPFFTHVRHFFLYNGNSFGYPGLILLLSVVTLFLQRKKFSARFKKILFPHIFSALIFGVLMLGPFLNVANRFFISLEGIPVYVPLPYFVFHFIPGLSGMRAPSRFLPAFVFFLALSAAYIIGYILKKASRKKRRFVLFSLFVLFFADQWYVFPQRIQQELPTAAYSYIQKDPQKSTILEIPFTARDGFQYIGFVHGISPMKGQLLHKKPIIGGYLARVHPEIFRYYRELPFIGHIASVIDKGNYNPYKEQPGEPKVVQFTGDLKAAEDELDFLQIKYVLVKDREKYTAHVKDLLGSLGFQEVLIDGRYRLYQREPQDKEFTHIEFGGDKDYFYPGYGFEQQEEENRWVRGDFASVFVRVVDTDKKELMFEASSFHESQTVSVYLNRQLLRQVRITTDPSNVVIPLSAQLKKGINTIDFKFEKTFRPAQVLPGNPDRREISAKFFSLKLR